MSKLRIKVSGCMRSMHGAEAFCAIRSYLATAARHGTGALEALISAFQGRAPACSGLARFYAVCGGRTALPRVVGTGMPR